MTAPNPPNPDKTHKRIVDAVEKLRCEHLNQKFSEFLQAYSQLESSGYIAKGRYEKLKSAYEMISLITETSAENTLTRKDLGRIWLQEAHKNILAVIDVFDQAKKELEAIRSKAHENPDADPKPIDASVLSEVMEQLGFLVFEVINRRRNLNNPQRMFSLQ